MDVKLNVQSINLLTTTVLTDVDEALSLNTKERINTFQILTASS